MANNEINDLTAKTTPVSTDEVEIQETAGGLSKKATVGNLAKGMSYNDLNDKPSIPTVSDTAYDATSWNGNLDAPTKNAVRDKIESMGSGSGDVTGPASSTATALAMFTDTTGKAIDDTPATYTSGTGTFDFQSGALMIDAGSATAGGDLIAAGGFQTDTISERTAAAGVTIDGVLVKDGEVDGVDVSTTYRTGGTDVALADGGTGASLTDPNADRIMFWDDSAGAVTWLTPSTGLTVSGTNMTVRTSSATQTGIVELATTAETTTATDTARAVTPAGIGAERSATATLTNKTISTGSTIDANVTVTEVLKKVYPVGSIYINRTSSTNPATLLGFGTWTAIEDKMIMARGSTYTADGGAATHTHDLSDNGYAKVAPSNPGPAIGAISVPDWTATHNYGASRSDSSASRNSGAALDGTTDAGSTIPPMIVAYVWERTA